VVEAPAFDYPATCGPGGAAPQVAYVWKTEEKGSDVNLGVHLVRDAYTRAFDEAGPWRCRYRIGNEIARPKRDALLACPPRGLTIMAVISVSLTNGHTPIRNARG
jgi:hypothetical protein